VDLLQHRLTALVLAVLVLGGAVLAASLRSHPAPAPAPAKTTAAAPRASAHSDTPAAAHGWRWDVASPGYHLGQNESRWNQFDLTRRDVPAGAGVLAATRTSQSARADLIYAQKGCVGVQLSRGPRRLLCPPRTPAVVVVDAHMVPGQGKPFYGLFLIGVVRSDVTRVTIAVPGEKYVDATSGTRVIRQIPPQVVYEKNAPSPWGAFQLTTGQPGAWHAIVNVYGAHGKLATLQVRPAKAGDAAYCAGAAGSAC